MTADLHLRRKWTFRAHERTVVLIKKHNEKSTHVFMKALLWAIYLPDYPDLRIEYAIGDRFKPDLVAMDPQNGRVLFWAEAGQVKPQKIGMLIRRHPDCHLVIARWGHGLDSFAREIQKQLRNSGSNPRGSTHIEGIQFNPDAHLRCIDQQGNIQIQADAFIRRYIHPP